MIENEKQMHRREFIRVVGTSGVSLWLARTLIGCGESSPSSPDLNFPTQSEPPILPGPADIDWWIRGNYGPVADEIEAVDLEVLGV